MANVARVDYHCSVTVHEAYRQLSVTLQVVYERREANQIAGIVVEYLTGYNNTERIVYKQEMLTQNQQETFHYIILDLLAYKPVQYALHQVYWYGMKLYVDERVLIPRPETEELVTWLAEEVSRQPEAISSWVLDIGTGSGCIALALKKELPWAMVFATDISDDALQVAKRNADDQQAEIFFSITDITDAQQWEQFASFDYIISNPPYVTSQESLYMSQNVLKYEPHPALFVPDSDPLLFYKAISVFGLRHLNAGGKVFLEINEMFCHEVTTLLSQQGYVNIEARKDMQGKDRMVKAEKHG